MMDTFWQQHESQLLITVVQGGEVLGYIVFDSTIRGRACGGLRMLPDIDAAEMQGLARAMTLKYGFLGLPQGGAKGGVRGDPEAPQQERWHRLATFGKAIAPLLLKRLYVPTTDMGTANADIAYMLEAVGVRVEPRQLRGTQSGYYTAVTVFTGAKQAMQHLGLRLSDCKVAIEGFGQVGCALAGLLAAANARVVAISTSRGAIFNPRGLDVKQLSYLAAESGSRVVDRYVNADRIDHAELLQLPVDVLCPCARHNSLHLGNATSVSARVLCPGANNPVTPEAEQLLFERGMLCLPDFVTNCGGVLGGTMEFASVSKSRIVSFLERHIGKRIVWLLDEAVHQQRVPREIAVPFALRRHDQMRRSAAHPTPLDRLFEAGLNVYRRGWIPGRLIAPLSLSYFERSLV
jgi:glutamate dehydrogenase (NAD(P)+)